MSVPEAAAGPVLAGPVPPEKPLSFFEMLRTAPDNAIATVPVAAYKQPVWETRFGPQAAFFVNDPQGVKQVLLDDVANFPKAPQELSVLAAAFGEGLLTIDGEKWRRHRRIMAPSFDFKSLVSYAPAMTATTEAFLTRWKTHPTDKALDIGQEMTDLTLRVISRTMFSADGEEVGALVSDTLTRGMQAMDFGLLDMLPLIGPWRVERKLAKIRRVFAELNSVMYPLIAARTAKNSIPAQPDLLDRLIAARDDEGGGRMTDQEVRDEIVIIFLAGHETTAVAMTFVWYLLSQHPEHEAKLHAELDFVLGGRAPSYDDLARLPYTRMVIEEAMRLYPPAPGLSARQAQAETIVSGVRVPKGALVLVMPWVLHRHRALWNNPDHFEPERFMSERVSARPRFAYLPFGGGPRICIGASLAQTEASLILATIAQRYRLRLAPGQKIELRHRITLRPKEPIRMILEPRSPSS